VNFSLNLDSDQVKLMWLVIGELFPENLVGNQGELEWLTKVNFFPDLVLDNNSLFQDC